MLVGEADNKTAGINKVRTEHRAGENTRSELKCPRAVSAGVVLVELWVSDM